MATDSKPSNVDNVAREARQQQGSRMGGMAGVPTEKSKDFSGSTRRLLSHLAPERAGAPPAW